MPTSITNTNNEIAELLEEFAELLEAKGVDYKPRAYRDAAESVREASADELEEPTKIENVGDSIGSKIEEYLETGTIEELEDLRDEIPVDIEAITGVEGVGPKTAGKLYEELGITNLNELEKAAKNNRIQEVKGFGPKTEENILEGIEFAKRKHERTLLGDALPLSRDIESKLDECTVIEKTVVGGSIRRRKETIGDIDIVVVSREPKEVGDYVTDWDSVQEVIQEGDDKVSLRLKDLRLDLHIVESEEFGGSVQYFTGSKQHNVAMRNRAIDQGLKLNEYGLWKTGEDGSEKVAGDDEEEIYDYLGLDFVPPELREDRGEIEAAEKGELPSLVETEDIKGDLHSHTQRTDGKASLREMVEGAVEKGYDYLAVTDHTVELSIANGLDEGGIRGLASDVRQLNDEYEVELFTGAEANILEDGDLDISDRLAQELDIVVASVHTSMSMEKEEATERLVSAIEKPGVDILGHPSGRLLNQREAYAYDFGRVLEKAKKEGVALELNSNPHRLDIWDTQVRRAIEEGVKIAVNTDAHSLGDYGYIEYGVATARRGWAEKKDVLNTMSVNELKNWL